MNIFSLDGRVALVTGASRGLGLAMAQALAAAGAHVVLAARDEARLVEEAEAIRRAGGRADVEAFDLLDDAAVVGAVPRIVAVNGHMLHVDGGVAEVLSLPVAVTS